MKYPKVKALVPAGEHFDESGIVNEGGFLSVAHLDAIEGELVQNGAAIQNLQLQFDTATANATTLQTTIDGLNTQIGTLQTAATANATTINTQQDRITELEAQVAELGGQSSGTGTKLVVKQDEVVTEKVNSTGLPAWNSPDHPANQRARRAGIPIDKKEA